MGAQRSSINIVHLLGRVEASPKISYTSEGVKVGEFCLTLWDHYKTAARGWTQEVDTLPIKGFARQADIVESAVRPGGIVSVVGKLKRESKFVVVAHQIIALPGTRDAGDDHHQAQQQLAPLTLRSYSDADVVIDETAQDDVRGLVEQLREKVKEGRTRS